jgi:hypothetical protein
MSSKLTIKDFVKMLKKTRNEQLNELHQLRNKNSKKMLIIFGVLLALCMIGLIVGCIIIVKNVNWEMGMTLFFIGSIFFFALIPAPAVYYYFMLLYIRPYEHYTEEEDKILTAKMTGGRKQNKLYKAKNKKYKKI